MGRSRILVVEHQSDAGLGLVGDRLEASPLDVDVVGPETGVPVPASLDGYDGLIVLGGSMGPTEDDRAPWLPATRSLLREGVERELPTLGICLGAQLLATATGGQVRTIPEGPEVGVHSVRVGADAEGDPLFDALSGAEAPVVQWHWLEVGRLPEGASVLASSRACANQAFRIGDRAWGVQFHPEALGSTAQDWATDGQDDLDELGLDGAAVVAAVRAAEPELREVWAQLADRFIGVVSQRGSHRDPR